MTLYYSVEAMQMKCVVLVVDSDKITRLKMKNDYSRLFRKNKIMVSNNISCS